MKTNDNGRARRGAMAFTLVEIMVAVGMLMLIMSFLFQFVLGSQRLWSASDHTGQVFDNAQLVMDMLGQDVRNLQYANQIGRSRPFYYADQGLSTITFEGKALPASKTKMFMFITQANEAADSQKTTLYPVIYIYVGDTCDDPVPLIQSIAFTLFRVVLARHDATGSSGTGDDGGLSPTDLTKIRQFPLIDYTTTLTSDAAATNNTMKDDLVSAIRSLELTEEETKIVVIPAHTLFGDYPPKIPEDEIKPMDETGEIVLSRVVIPEYIIVHDGVPSDSSAGNYWVRYKDYIKNVACSEIYPTWPESTIYANILAIMSFTLNRVYTEWYRNQGYNFTITSLLPTTKNIYRVAIFLKASPGQ